MAVEGGDVFAAAPAACSAARNSTGMISQRLGEAADACFGLVIARKHAKAASKGLPAPDPNRFGFNPYELLLLFRKR